MTPAGVGERALASAEEAGLVARLRAGDEQAFRGIVGRYHSTMLAVARTYVRTQASAEEVVQDAWLGVLNGLDRFEDRSSLKTWIMRIVIKTALTRGAREARSVPFSSLALKGEEPAVSPDRFRGANDALPGHWNRYPRNWQALPEEVLLGHETLEIALAAIEELPEVQRLVITLRDVHGWTNEEVCEALEVASGNQRVLLHRARSRVRAAIERHLDG